MKLSERIKDNHCAEEKQWDHLTYQDDESGICKICFAAQIKEVEELERKAALWDKVSELPDWSELQRRKMGNDKGAWRLNSDSIKGMIYAETLEEALNQIPEVKA